MFTILPAGRLGTSLERIKYNVVSTEFTYRVDCSYSSRAWVLPSTCIELPSTFCSTDIYINIPPGFYFIIIIIIIINSSTCSLFIITAVHKQSVHLLLKLSFRRPVLHLLPVTVTNFTLIYAVYVAARVRILVGQSKK